MAPLPSSALSTYRSAEPNGERTSTIDLILLSLALLDTVALTVIQVVHRQAHNFHYANAVSVASFANFFALLAISLCVATIVLAWTRTLSLDAVGTILFTLAPSILAFPFTIIRGMLQRCCNVSTGSLYLSQHHFRYIRSVQGASKLYVRYLPVEKWTRTYLRRKLTAWSLEGFYLLKGRERPTLQPQAEHPEEFGTRMESTAHCITLRDHEHGLKSWWFRSASSAIALARDPSPVRVSGQSRMLRGLALVADIVAIGDLVLQERRSYLKRLLAQPGMKYSLDSAAGKTCNAILSELKIHEWGTISADMRSQGYQYPERQPAEYGILFFIVSVKSDLYSMDAMKGNRQFMQVFYRWRTAFFSKLHIQSKGSQGAGTNCAQEVLDKIQAFEGTRHEFRRLKQVLVDEWLKVWGIKVVQNLPSIAAPRRSAPVAPAPTSS